MAYDLERVKTKLAEIYAFYAPNGHLKSGKFVKLCLDAGVVERKVSDASNNRRGHVSQQQVDVLFRRAVRTPAIGMTFEEFLDAMVELSVLKFPSIDKDNTKQALSFFFEDYLSPFQDPRRHQQAENTLRSEAADLAATVRSNFAILEALYNTHLPNEVNPHFRPPMSSQTVTSQKNFLAIFQAARLVPDFVAKPAVYQVFRDVVSMRDLSVLAPLAEFPDSGVVLTFRKFVHALVTIVRLHLSGVFPDCTTDGRRLQALLRWMDDLQSLASVPAREPAVVQPKSEINSLVRLLFQHYVRLGDPLNERWLSSLKWSRFLKDGGVWASQPGECLSVGGFVSAVDADMLFVQTAGRSATGKLDLAGFHTALRALAPRLLAGLVKKGFLSFRGEAPDSWLVLMRCMLEPLAKVLGVSDQQENDNPELAQFILPFRPAIAKLFRHVSADSRMTRDEFIRLAVAISVPVPLLVVHKIFNACKSSDSRESLTPDDFEKALLELAVKATPGRDVTDKDRVTVFLTHLNNTPLAAQLATYPHLLFDAVAVSAPVAAASAGRSLWHNLVAKETN